MPKTNLTGRSGAFVLALLALAGLLLSACSEPPGPTPEGLNEAYEAALDATAAPVAKIFEEGSPEERAALDRLSDYFVQMTPDSVASDTASVYSPDAFLYDNLAAVQGLDNIRSYFTKAASEVDELTVEFLQVARSDEDYFIRWRMTIVAPNLDDSGALVSYGMTQFRFDSDGRVLLHRDFWDAATGLYEYLPVLGGLVARTRGTLAEFSGD
jgi:hypothetical protein